MIEIQSPNRPKYDDNFKYDMPTIFLAGSIEMGIAENWQTKIVNSLKSNPFCAIFNPRRDNWDSSWEQKESNSQFNEQVTWELDYIDKADLVLFYFDPNTKSPVTLLELGIALASKKNMIVCCPEGFYRKGNVDITCSKFGVKVYSKIDEVISILRELNGIVNFANIGRENRVSIFEKVKEE